VLEEVRGDHGGEAAAGLAGGHHVAEEDGGAEVERDGEEAGDRGPRERDRRGHARQARAVAVGARS
jgi:hypothetical protein